ncbi:hypothetical protein DJ78_14170 [Halorubrum ezzemoulense]|uniref:Uncharacterized protein n=1 Tax=Halorubrum ezzemoulense TaxID=337243 RepID=A0A256JGT3_HALEZ|nr:hypothetical protein DJ78_14170 [Halorubrum ezzemoulense]
MALQTQTITVDRVSNSGNAIADQQHAGKTVLVPAGEVGVEYDVRLVDQGSHFEAKLVDRTEQTQPSQPSIGPDTSNLGKGRGKDSHSHKIQSSPAGGRLRGTPGGSGKKQRRRMSQRKK